MKRELKSIRRSLDGIIKRIDNILEEEKPLSINDMTLAEQLDYIVDGVCDFWGISRKELFKKSHTVAHRRKYAIMLMQDYTSATQKEMSDAVGLTQSNSAYKVITSMEEKLSNKPWGDSKMRHIYESLIQYLELPPSKYYDYGK